MSIATKSTEARSQIDTYVRCIPDSKMRSWARAVFKHTRENHPEALEAIEQLFLLGVGAGLHAASEKIDSLFMPRGSK